MSAAPVSAPEWCPVCGWEWKFRGCEPGVCRSPRPEDETERCNVCAFGYFGACPKCGGRQVVLAERERAALKRKERKR